MEERDESPIEAALELCVYAPLGFALEARSLLPRFVERGRNQVAMARVVGKFAVQKGRGDLEGRVAEGHATVLGLLRLTGVLADDDGHEGTPTARGTTAGAGTDGPSTTTRATSGRPVGRTGPSPSRRTGLGEDGPVGGRGDGPTREAAPLDAPAVDTLAIHGYESLSASQVVPRLDSLTPTELEDVRRYERAHRGRKTILNKIVQLQTA